MLFNSILFVIFYLAVLLVYYLLPRKIRWIWLFAASYVFYGAWNAKYLLLLMGMSLVTYLAGFLIDWSRTSLLNTETRKKISRTAVVAAVICNIGLLVYFKYLNMFASTLSGILGRLGIASGPGHFDILLPVGISFISFQSLGYVIDVYRGKIQAEKNPFRYSLFIAFFPQLVAGPIERSENLLTQIQNIHNQKQIRYETFTDGLVLMLVGYFQKVVIADRLSIFVVSVFKAPEQYNSIILLLGAAAFAVQIYCDFGGYSNIAVGAAKTLGFEMMENFNAPYFSSSIKEFWRRWHISLSSWFRDYLYIPLGGNRQGTIRKYLNLMITFLASGLWHGAAWHYVIWGGIHGFYQIAGDLFSKAAGRGKSKTGWTVRTEVFSYKLLKILCTFFLTTFAWIFFRAESTRDAFVYIRHLFTAPDIGVLFNGELYQLGLTVNDLHALLFCLLILLLVDFVRYYKNIRIERFLSSQNLWFKWAVLLTLIFCIVIFGHYGLNYDAAEFIYFKF